MEKPIDVLMEEINEEIKRIMPSWLNALRDAYEKELKEKGVQTNDS